jgi:hypothetical protein
MSLENTSPIFKVFKAWINKTFWANDMGRGVRKFSFFVPS